MSKAKYIVAYVSVVTGNSITSACADKNSANREAAALRKEGCKNIRVYPFTPSRVA